MIIETKKLKLLYNFIEVYGFQGFLFNSLFFPIIEMH